MVPLSLLAAFALASVLLILIPGPSVLFVLGRSIAYGRRAGLLSVLGNALGMLPAVALVAIGVGALLARSELVFTIVKLVGAGYLVYLGVHAIVIRRRASAAVEIAPPPRSSARLVLEGFVVGATNPKTIAFFVAVLPQFVDPAAGSVPVQLAELGSVFVLLALLLDSAWALVAGTARDWFARSPKRVERLSATGGVMMIGLGGVLALSESRAT